MWAWVCGECASIFCKSRSVGEGVGRYVGCEWVGGVCVWVCGVCLGRWLMCVGGAVGCG